MSKSPIRNIHELLATFFLVGKAPKAPGTFGTLAAAVLYFFLPFVAPNTPIGVFYASPFWLLFLIAFFFLGVYVSGEAEKTMGHDNGHIVIDEVCGYWMALIFFPPTLYYTIFGFLLFRFFDIFKPYPINLLQKLPRGWGVMVDDVAAGLFTAVTLWLIDLFCFLIR